VAAPDLVQVLLVVVLGVVEGAGRRLARSRPLAGRGERVVDHPRGEVEAGREQRFDRRADRREQPQVLGEQQDADGADDTETEGPAEFSGAAFLEQESVGPHLECQGDGFGLPESEPRVGHRPRHRRRKRTLDDPARLGGARCLPHHRRGHEDGGEEGLQEV